MIGNIRSIKVVIYFNNFIKLFQHRLKFDMITFKKYYRRVGFTKENSCYSMKHQKWKDLLLLAIKLIKYPMLVMLKNTITHFWKTKIKNWWNNKNNYSTTKHFGKPKHYCYKISYYKTSKKLLMNFRRLYGRLKSFSK